MKKESKSTYKLRHTIYSNYVPPRMNSAPASERDKQKPYKHHIFEPTARCTILPKLRLMIELVKAIKKVPIIF